MANTPSAQGFVARHRFLLAFTLLSSFMGTSVGLAKVTTTLYALHLGAEGGVLGVLAGAQSLGILVMSLPLGVWVERFGPARLFVFGSSVVGLLYVVVPLVPATGFLIGATLAIGFFMPFRFVSLNTVFLAELERIGEARAGWFRGTHMTGMFLLGPMLAAAAVHAVGHAGTFWLIAAMFAITIALSPLVFSQASAPAAKPRGAVLVELRALLADPGARRIAFQEAAIQALNMYYAFYIVVIALQQFGLPAASAGTLVAVQGAAFVFALFVLGGTVTRWGARTVPAAVLLIGAACLALGLAPGVAWLWIGGVVLGLGLGLLQIQTLTQFARLGARLGRGRVAGLNALVGPSGGLLGGLLGGTLGARVGLQTLFLAFIPLFAALAWQARRPIVAAVSETPA